MVYAVTGHRFADHGIHNRLVDFARCVLHGIMTQDPDAIIVTGMALGWDIACADACRRLSIPYAAFIPCADQDKLWSKWQKELYEELLPDAAYIHHCSTQPYQAYLMHKRNEEMVNASERVLALYDGRGYGGTRRCMEYAVLKGIPITNLWDEWVCGGCSNA